MATLDWLESEDHNENYMAIHSNLIQLPKGQRHFLINEVQLYDCDLHRRLLVVSNNILNVSSSGIKAWGFGRYVYLCAAARNQPSETFRRIENDKEHCHQDAT